MLPTTATRLPLRSLWVCRYLPDNMPVPSPHVTDGHTVTGIVAAMAN
jgi:hypothetical protein